MYDKLSAPWPACASINGAQSSYKGDENCIIVFLTRLYFPSSILSIFTSM